MVRKPFHITLPVIFRIIACMAVCCLCVVAYIFNPSETSWFPKCFLYQTTGLFCTGCGNTRALHAFLHGRILEGIGHNALLIPLVILLIILHWKPEKIYKKGIIRGIAITILLFTVLRNIPFYPFTLLAP